MQAGSSQSFVTNRKRKVSFSKIRNSLKRKRVRFKEKNNTDGESEALDDATTGIADFEELLETSAERNNLNATNVKSLLRSIITNSDVLSVIKQSTGETSSNTFNYEPKLTRSKVRELCGPYSNLPSSGLRKNKDETLSLLGKELSDSESSDDEYVPGDDPEESEDDEASVLSSDIGLSTPVSTPSSVLEEREVEDGKDTRGTDEFPELVIAEENGDLIAQRTRSRLPLTDTPIENIEFAFIAPDITTDLYDSDCEDEEWKQFLRGFYKTSEEPVPEPEDDGDDPEYNFLEEEDVVDDLELRSDRAVKISKKELNDLVAELMEATEGGLNVDDEEETEEHTSSSSTSTSTFINIPSSDTICQMVLQSSPPLISDECRALLDEQMRKHIQLLTQMHILSQGQPSLVQFQNNAKALICEIKCLSKKTLPDGEVSAFQAHNLEEALRVVSNTDFPTEAALNPRKRLYKYPRSLARSIPKPLQTIIADCPALMYANLLPTRALLPPSVNTKFCFTPAEDMLIALGLEEFTPIKKIYPLSKLLKTFLLPLKSERQLWVHIKNTRRVKSADKNPISYFFKYLKAPRVSSIAEPCDAQHVVPPCKNPSDALPEWVKPYRRREERFVPISPAAPKTNSSTLASAGKSFKRSKCLRSSIPKKKYNFILPWPSLSSRNPRTPSKQHLSPLKQISPILKKYGYRRIVMRTPVNFALSRPKIHNSTLRRIAPKVDPKLLRNATKNLSSALKRSSDLEENNHAAKPNSKKDSILAVKSRVHVENSPKSVKVGPQDVQLQESIEQAPIPDTANDGGSQSEMDTCEEEEEVQDNEGDLAALMTASSTICKSSLQLPKRTRQQKELESTLSLIDHNLPDDDPQKEAREMAIVHSFMCQVKEALLDDQDTYGSFLQLLVDFSLKPMRNPVHLFNDIKELLKNYPQLVVAFVPFLLPGQAVECGVFSSYHLQEKVLIFWLKLELYFNHQPRQLKKIRQALINLNKSRSLTPQAICSTIQPFLRNHSHLIEELHSILPDQKPAEILQSEFEDFTIPDEECDVQDSDDIFEDFVLPETEDLYGTGQCPCVCHENSTDLRMKNMKRHCIKCGICFIDGRVFLHVGKVLKPARIIRHHRTFGPETQAQTFPLSSPETPTVQTITTSTTQIMNSPSRQVLQPSSSQQPYNVTSTSVLISTSIFDCDSDSRSPSKLPPGKDLKARLESGISDLLTFPSETVQPEVMGNCTIMVHPEEPETGRTSVNEEWTKDEDKLLLETCQKLGATDETFEQVKLGLSNRTLESIKTRFWELLQIFSNNHESAEDDISDGN